MTIVIPDARTPAGVKCWVRDYEDRPWAEHAFEGMLTASGYPFLAYSRNWRYCRLDDPVEGWVANTGVQPVADATKVEVKFAKAAPSAVSAASNWHWSIEFAVGDITHWRYPRTKEPEMKQQQTLMQFDPATGVERPYPSHAEQWRKYHGHMAWLFNPWTGTRRLAGDVGSDAFGLLVVPPDEPVPASNAPLESTEARYRDLLNRLGVQGHDGAVAEIESLRAGCGRMQGV